MNIIQQLDQEQVEKLSAGREIPDFQPGDTVLVNVKVVEGDKTRVQAYEGVCIGRSGRGINENFTVRKISYGEGVERVFPLHAPMIELDQGGAPRQGAPRQALLPARIARQEGAHRGAGDQRAGSGRGGGQGIVAATRRCAKGAEFGPFLFGAPFVVGTGPNGYIACMVSKAHRIILADHARLPWRFFGRLTAVQAGL